MSHEAADVWRVMAKDTRNLKKRMSTASILGLAQPLQHLLVQVVLEAEDEYVVLENVQGDNSDHRSSSTNEVDGFDTDKVEEATQRDGKTLELEDIDGLFDADVKDIADPDIVMIDNDDGGELAHIMELESEVEPAVEFVSQSVRRKQSVQFQFQTQELAASAVKPWQLLKERLVCTPRPLFCRRTEEECRPG